MKQPKRYTKYPATQQRFALLDDGEGRRCFIKAYAHAPAEHYRRGQLLHEIGTQSGVFKAPKPMAFVETAGLAVWECLRRPLSVRDVLVRNVRANNRASGPRKNLATMAGAALATIHDGFAEFKRGPSLQPIELPHDIAEQHRRRILDAIASSPVCAIHGDYTLTNLFLEDEGDSLALVVIDPAPNPYLFQGSPASATCPSIVDCSLWYYSLRFHRATSRILAHESKELLEQFLEGYRSRSGSAPAETAVELCSALIALQNLKHFPRKSIRDISSLLDRFYRSRTARKILTSASRSA